MPDVIGLVTSTVNNKKIKEVDKKKTDLNGLVKKINYNAKILKTEWKHFTTLIMIKFTSEIFDSH